MIYFDSDVLIHYLVVQDQNKHSLATRLYERAAEENKLFVSLLCLQEISFVLSKLKVPHDIVSKKVGVFLTKETVNYDSEMFKRACLLAEIMGYQNINDCLHTAIAGNYCTEIYTFNQSDFKHIQRYTKLKVSIL